MSEWVDGLGCTPAERKRSLPPSLPPSRFVIREVRQEFDAPSPSIQAGKSATRTSMGPPPQAPRLGLDLGTWQDSPLRRNRSSSPCDPSHRWLGERAWGAGWPNQTRTHAPAARLTEKTPCWLRKLNQYSPGAWGTEGTTLDQKGLCICMCICACVVSE